MTYQHAIEFDHVSRVFGSGKTKITAVDDISFTIEPGRVLCLVGETGCGKSTSGKMLAGLVKPSSGRILYGGKDVAKMSTAEQHHFRRAVQIIHQDPYASLNPVRNVRQILSAPLQRHKMVKNRLDLNKRLHELLAQVSLTPPSDFLEKYPHQLSGGQRQRVSIARALTVNPDFIVADEAVSSVDVSLRVSLLKILLDLQENLGVTFLMITHDLAVAKHFGWNGQIGVMYLGRMVELAETPKIINDPVHPYTRALLSSLPEADPDLTRTKQRLDLRSPEIPSLLNLPSGCTFHPRCPLFQENFCELERPALDVYNVDNHLAACLVMAKQAGAPIQLEQQQGTA